MSRLRDSALVPLALIAVTASLVLSGFAFAGGETSPIDALASLNVLSGSEQPDSTSATPDDQVDDVDVFEGEAVPQQVSSSSPTLEPLGVFDLPVEVIARPGDDRNFVVEQGGKIVATNGTDQAVVLDITSLTGADGERGLLGAAFHPELSLLYVHYSDAAGDSVLTEFVVDPATAVADQASLRVVMTVAQPYENHNGGEVVFGPDRMLYWGLGDGGLANDPERAALDLSSPLGKILRIDPTLGDDGSAYTVPADNPFVGVQNANESVWSYGLRNPWRFSFDAATGDLWIADVGQYSIEEVNFAEATNGELAGRGLSFGWSAYEGTTQVNEDQVGAEHVDPVLTYTHESGSCSISGGAVYRGERVASLDGWYVYGDYCTGIIWAFDTSARDGERELTQVGQIEALVAIAGGAEGELFAVSHSGIVFEIAG